MCSRSRAAVTACSTTRGSSSTSPRRWPARPTRGSPRWRPCSPALCGTSIRAVASLGSDADADAATEAAGAAIMLERRLEHAYYGGMADLLGIEDRNERIARRELYRSCSRLDETLVDVAERVVDAVMKES